MPDTAYRPFTVQQARILPDPTAFRGPAAAAAAPARTRTFGRTLVATGPAAAEPGVGGSLTWGRYGDGSRFLEVHRDGRFLGLYR